MTVLRTQPPFADAAFADVERFAFSVVNFRQCSGFHQTSRSAVSIHPKFKPPFSRDQYYQSRIGRSHLMRLWRNLICRYVMAYIGNPPTDRMRLQFQPLDWVRIENRLKARN